MDIKNQLFDKLIEAVDVQEEQNVWNELYGKAKDELFASMTDGHIEIILKEQKKINDGIIRLRDGECHNLYLIVEQMLFFHCHSKLHNLGKKYPLFLPSCVVREYLKYNDWMLDGICQKCDYLTFGSHFKGKCPFCESLK